MEFPQLHRHCSLSSCNRIDFLPVKCLGCSKIFCSSHYSYDGHKCPTPQVVDFQVPICPLCETPVSMRSTDDPNNAVSIHMANKCKPTAPNIYTNKCAVRGCKLKTMIKIACAECSKAFCLRHRHPADHVCDSYHATDGSQRRSGGSSAISQGDVRRAKLFAACAMRGSSCNVEAKLANLSVSKNAESSSSEATAQCAPPLSPTSTCRQQERDASKTNRDELVRKLETGLLQGDLNEEEALALALLLSEEQNDPPATSTSTSNQTGKAR